MPPTREFASYTCSMTRLRIVIVALLAPVVAPAAPVAISDPQELLARVDVSYGRYGKKLFGPPKVGVFRAMDGSVILAHQARYGGDGDHSENRLMLFGFRDGRGQKLLDQNIDFVEFVEEAGTLRLIRGKDVESLCDVCDGWDAAEADDVFFIPILLDVETLTVRADLSEEEKQRLLSRVEQRAARKLTETRKYGRDYGTFAATVTDRVRGLLATGRALLGQTRPTGLFPRRASSWPPRTTSPSLAKQA